MPLDTLQQPAGRFAGRFFYGVQGTPFISAAEAWFWTLDCLDARADGSRGCAALKVGRPCEPDDVVNAMARLILPETHARAVMAWGKRRETPPRDTEARRLWDQVMQRLCRVLQAKGIVGTPVRQSSVSTASCASASAGASAKRTETRGCARDDGGALDRALEKLGAAVAAREAAGGSV
ncbi:MAG: hypothetical protein ABSC06_25105 [Rhodopila sp.]|jgi:hypothetical protein